MQSPPCLRVGERVLPWIAGAMHYFRVPRRGWARCLDRLVELGVSLVDTAVPWGLHERGDQAFDFGDGPSHDGFERDLGRFLGLCQERGLCVVLRPGPTVNCELPYFGLPPRLTRDPTVFALGASGAPCVIPLPPHGFVAPSYAAPAFLRAAGSWLKAFGDFVEPFVFPKGPVVACEVDHELCGFYRTAAYDLDYHPEAIAQYRQYLGRRYPDALPPGYGALAVDALEPPRRFSPATAADLVPHLDWMAFKSWSVGSTVERFARILSMCGLDRAVLFHIQPAADFGAVADVPELEQAVVFCGLDLAHRRRDYTATRRLMRRLSASSSFPCVPALGSGAFSWWWPLDFVDDQKDTAVAALMHGAQGFGLTMAVGRDQWAGAPITHDGEPRQPLFETVRRFVAASRRLWSPGVAAPTAPQAVVAIEPAAAGRTAAGPRVGIVVARSLEQLALCASLVDPAPPLVLDLLGLGAAELCPLPAPLPGISAPDESYELLHTLEQLLDTLRLAHQLLVGVHSAEQLARYDTLLVLGTDPFDAALFAALLRYHAAGGSVIFTPRLPTLDERLAPLAWTGAAAHVVTVDGLPEALAAHVAPRRATPLPAVQSAAQATLPLDLATVDLAVVPLTDGTQALFLANRTPARARIQLAELSNEVRAATDALSGEPVTLRAVALEPNEVRWLFIERDDRPTQAAADRVDEAP